MRHYCLALSIAYFASAGMLAAQSSKPPTTPDSTPEASQKSAQPQSIEILIDTQGVDFGPYLSDLRARLLKSWYSLVPKGVNGAKGKLVIEFEIHRDGHVAGMKQIESTGDASLDQAAWDAVTAASPFMSLPKEFNGDFLILRGVFCYFKRGDSSFCSDPSTVGGTARVPNQDSAPSVFCAPGTARTKVDGAEVLTDAQGADLLSYLNAKALPLVRANWYRLVSSSHEKTGGNATVQFTIRNDGSVTAVKLVDGAGHAVLGDLATKAVEKSGPLPALPSEFAAKSADVRMRFTYAPECEPNAGPFLVVPTCQGSTTGCVAPPRIASSPSPQNVQQAGVPKYSGTVSLQLTVNTEGKPENITVVKSLGPGLDQKAIEAVRNWKFEPAMKDGKPVAAQIVVEVDFHLYDKDESKPAKP